MWHQNYNPSETVEKKFINVPIHNVSETNNGYEMKTTEALPRKYEKLCTKFSFIKEI